MTGPRQNSAEARSPRSTSGQATVELIALLPVLVMVAFAVYAVIVSFAARELASQASEAGAVALLQEEDAREAAEKALPADRRRASRIRIDGRRVTVEVRPELPVRRFEDALKASVTSDAGREAR